MDSGGVSTETLKQLIVKTGAKKFAEIDGEDFYIYSFPGPMDVTAMFRPHAVVQDGLVQLYQAPQNLFFASESENMIFFIGKEPNLEWPEFAECIFELCELTGVKEICFVGSMSALVPHTRATRITCSCSDVATRKIYEEYGFSLANYEGPAGIITYLLSLASRRDIKMVSLVGSVPVYVHGDNPDAINTMTSKVAAILGLSLNLDDLHEVARIFERRLSELIDEEQELSETIKRLEADYDSETFDHEMPDLKRWLLQKGVRVD
jgi:proteasome assembly chaperone (PAC2) family protein